MRIPPDLCGNLQADAATSWRNRKRSILRRLLYTVQDMRNPTMTRRDTSCCRPSPYSTYFIQAEHRYFLKASGKISSDNRGHRPSSPRTAQSPGEGLPSHPRRQRPSVLGSTQHRSWYQLLSPLLNASLGYNGAVNFQLQRFSWSFSLFFRANASLSTSLTAYLDYHASECTLVRPSLASIEHRRDFPALRRKRAIGRSLGFIRACWEFFATGVSQLFKNVMVTLSF